MTNGFEFTVGLINIILLYLGLRFILIKPLQKVAQEREQAAKQRIDEAEAIYNEAKAQLEKYQKLNQGIEAERAKLLKDATNEANEIARTTAVKTEREATEMVSKVKLEMNDARHLIVDELRKRMADYIIATSRSILKRVFADHEAQRSTIKIFITALGKGAKQDVLSR